MAPDVSFLLFLLPLIFLLHFSLSLRANDNRTGSEDITVDLTKVTHILQRPRAYIYHGFLSHEECDHLISLTEGKLQKSMVTNDETGETSVREERTSSDLFLQKGQDETIARIERRIAAWTFLPEENGEAIQILRYEKGEKFDPHRDYFSDKHNTIGGRRLATLILYLSNVQKGGETVFPEAEGKDLQKTDETWSDCAKKGYAVKPKKGDALLFFSLHPNTTPDTYSIHGGCPVVEGVKWSAIKWVHIRPFKLSAEDSSLNNKCVDRNENCQDWAAAGECQKNAVYMVGDSERVGNCRKSCKVCEEPKEEESGCMDMDGSCS